MRGRLIATKNTPPIQRQRTENPYSPSIQARASVIGSTMSHQSGDHHPTEKGDASDHLEGESPPTTDEDREHLDRHTDQQDRRDVSFRQREEEVTIAQEPEQEGPARPQRHAPEAADEDGNHRKDTNEEGHGTVPGW